MIFRVCAVVAFAFWALAGCSSSSNTKSVQSNQPQTLSKSQGYQALATEKYGADVAFMPNASQSYVLCVQQSQPASGGRRAPLNFFIYDSENRKIVFEDSQVAGRVEWLSDDQIKVHVVPGVVRGDQSGPSSNIYIYDLKTGRKLSPGAQNRDE